MMLVLMMSFVKFLWPMLRFFSCTYDQDSRTPTKNANSYTESYTKTCISIHQNKNSIIHVMNLSLQIPPKRKFGLYKKYERNKRCHVKEAWAKKRKREIKDAMPKKHEPKKIYDDEWKDSPCNTRGVILPPNTLALHEHSIIMSLLSCLLS
jgi:hypothetical protein